MLEGLGCEKLAMVAYSVRHGGPSRDFMNIYRHLEEIQQKRQWRSSKSVLRHQKSSNLWSVTHFVKELWVPLATGYYDNFKRFVDDRTGDAFASGAWVHPSLSLGPVPHPLTDVDGRDVDVPRLHALLNCQPGKISSVRHSGWHWNGSTMLHHVVVRLVKTRHPRCSDPPIRPL